MEEFYYALTSLMEATQDRDKAREEYDGQSWGYAGYYYEQAIDKAKARFTEAFTAAVQEIITSHTPTEEKRI